MFKLKGLSKGPWQKLDFLQDKLRTMAEDRFLLQKSSDTLLLHFVGGGMIKHIIHLQYISGSWLKKGPAHNHDFVRQSKCAFDPAEMQYGKWMQMAQISHGFV